VLMHADDASQTLFTDHPTA